MNVEAAFGIGTFLYAVEMSTVVSQISKIKSLIWRYGEAFWDGLVASQPPKLFTVAGSLRAYFGGKDIQFNLEPNGTFSVVDQSHSWNFANRLQNYRHYKNGLAARGKEIGQAYFLNLIGFQYGDLVIDVGANVGDLKLALEKVSPNIQYLGLEPAPEEFRCLVNNVGERSSWNLGLWNKSCELEFFVSSDNADSSFIEPPGFDRTIRVTARRLDELIPEGTQVRLLKIEAEGAEPEVLEGCSGLLKTVDFISADLGFERGILQESTLPQVTNYLLEHGFEMVAVSAPRLVALFKRTSTS